MSLLLLRILSSLSLFLAVFFIIRYGVAPAKRLIHQWESGFDVAFRHKLRIDLEPRTALIGTLVLALILAIFAFGLTMNFFVAGIVGVLSLGLPFITIRHLQIKRLERLNNQLVDGLTTIASAIRAGLTMVQAFELLVKNHDGPIEQEFGQILREYEFGADLNQAMKSAADRIGSPLYRLTFTAIATHRKRGGDAAQSMDRIAASVREIHRLEGKLDAITAQGRTQAIMMAVMPLVFLGILYVIDKQGVTLLFVEPMGRMILLGVFFLIAMGFLWIRKIMAIDL